MLCYDNPNKLIRAPLSALPHWWPPCIHTPYSFSRLPLQPALREPDPLLKLNSAPAGLFSDLLSHQGSLPFNYNNCSIFSPNSILCIVFFPLDHKIYQGQYPCEFSPISYEEKEAGVKEGKEPRMTESCVFASSSQVDCGVWWDGKDRGRKRFEYLYTCVHIIFL